MAEHEFLTASKFYFEADSITEKIIKEVSGLGAESPPSEGSHGSGKGGVVARQETPSVSKFTHVTLKLVATTDTALYKWYEDCNKNMGDASAWDKSRKSASVTAYDQSNKMQARWELVNCYPCKYTGPTLTASSGDMATETIELVHGGIKRVPV